MPAFSPTFSQRIYVRAKNFERNFPRYLAKIALAVDREIVLSTPVDTGLARSNWVVQVGEPPDGVILPYAPGNKLGLMERANAQGALDQANSVLAKVPKEPVIFISNSVFYISTLNTGSSAQAPEFFVQNGIRAGVVVANRPGPLLGP